MLSTHRQGLPRRQSPNFTLRIFRSGGTFRCCIAPGMRLRFASGTKGGRLKVVSADGDPATALRAIVEDLESVLARMDELRLPVIAAHLNLALDMARETADAIQTQASAADGTR